jgi:hypothetical protein
MERRDSLLVSVVVFFILLFVYSKFGPSLPISLLSQSKGEPLVVQGTGTVAVVPDIAKLTVGIEETGTSLKSTQNSVNQKSQRLTEALKNLGIADKDIKTLYYNIYPETESVPVPMAEPAAKSGEAATLIYPQPPTGTSRITRYRVSTTYQVTIRDFDKVNDAITAATGVGANIVSGVNFDVNEETKNKKLTEAREEAVKDAKQKAQSLASAAGVSLGKLLNISESSYPRPYPMMTEGRGAADSSVTVKPDIQPGESEFTVTVVLSYDIR